MAVTRKVESIGALRLESGKTATLGSFGGTAQNLTVGDNAIAWVDFPVNGRSEIITDDSIEGQGFQDIPNQVRTMAEGSISGNLRYEGLDKFLFWVFGFEHPNDSPLVEYLFTVSGITTDPGIGSTWTNNSSTFTVREENVSSGSGTVRMERTAGTNDPLAGPETLLKTGGTGDIDMDYSIVSAKKQGHLFELDKHERHLTVFRSGEGSGIPAGDRKNRMATIGKARGTNDFRYQGAMCKRFSFSSTAGEIAKYSADFLAHSEAKGSFGSGSWTFPTSASGSGLNILHHHFTVDVGVSGSLLATGIGDFETSVDIPLQVIQDTESELFIIEPVLEGKYGITATITLPRHTADTFLANRDAFTDIAMKMTAVLGDREFSLFLSDMRVSESSVSDDDVAQVPVVFENGPDTTASPFIIDPTGSLKGYTITQGSPLICLLKNTNSTNEMRRE